MESQYLTPAETTNQLVMVGATKANTSVYRLLILGFLAGVYIAFGSHLFTVITTGTADYVGYGLTKFLGGLGFNVGLAAVIIAGAELFTGNTLMTIGLLEKKYPLSALLRNWLLVYFSNLIGSLLIVGLIYFSGANGSAEHLSTVGKTALSISEAKLSLSWIQVLIRGIIANWLVCLAVVMATSAKTITGKLVAMILPISTFVAFSMEHSIANMYFLPAGLLLNHQISGNWPILALFGNLSAATIGNLIGGSLFVGFAYWFAYLRQSKTN